MKNDNVASQGIKFIISGGISAVVDLGLTALFQYQFGFSEATARTIGFIFGTITAYMINRRWTFKAEPSTKRMIQVAILYCITYFVNVFGYKYGFRFFVNIGLVEGIATLIAFTIAQGTATVINFIVQRVWIFNKK